MDPVTDIRQLLETLRDGRADAGRAAQLAPGWSPARHPSFLDYLSACGALGPARNGPAATPATPRPYSLDSTAVSGAGAGGVPSTLSFPAPPEPPAPPAALGTSGGRYRPIRLHKVGGLGQVWLAHDTVLGREVALKVVRPERAGRADLVARFVREARVTGRLEHPGIVPLYDLVEGDEAWGSGPCYVMRYVSGGTLAEAVAGYHARLAQGVATPLEFRGLLGALVAVCQAVAYAHSRGVLHRDLKGQNVVLGEFGEVFLLDWGLTKLTGGGGDGEPDALAGDGAAETTEGVICGTPAYMAPEVAAGEDASAASDTYGLGAMLYAVLTGKAPVEGPTPAAILAKVRSEEPAPPHDVNPSTSRGLDAVCRKAMARATGDRYASAAALAADLQRWLADEPVAAYREPWADRAGRWARRHRPAVAAAVTTAVTAAVALAVGGTLLWSAERRTAEQRLATSAQNDRAEVNLDAAYLLTNGIVEVTERILPSESGSETKRLEMTQLAVNTYRLFSAQRPDSAESPKVRHWNAHLSRLEGGLLRLLGDTAAAERSYGVALDILRDDGPGTLRRAEILFDAAALQATTGRHRQALATLRDALAVTDGLRGVEPTAVPPQRAEAIIHLNRASVELSTGRPDLAAASAGQAVALFRGLLAAAAPDNRQPYDVLLLAYGQSYQATAERETGKLAAALATVTQAAETLKPLLTPGVRPYGFSQDSAFLLEMVCASEKCKIWLAGAADKKASAESYLIGVIARFNDLSGRHPRIPDYRGRLASAFIDRGEVREARAKPADAAADHEAARRLLEKLVAECPAIPAYRADLGRARLGLSRVTPGDPAAAARQRAAGLADLQAALQAAPDDAAIAKTLAAATPAAK